MNSNQEDKAQGSAGKLEVNQWVRLIAGELGLPSGSVMAALKLLSEGATIPFISRYRKEATGSLDEVSLMAIRDRFKTLEELDGRRIAIKKSLEERHILTQELRDKLDEATTMTQLEDIYAPFRPKRRTRAMIAREKGLHPLAQWIRTHQGITAGELNEEAEKYVNSAVESEKMVADRESALSGARDIIAEEVSDDMNARAIVRDIYEKTAVITSKVLTGKEEDASGIKFRDYYAWSEPLNKIPSHRLLALRRGESEGILMMRIRVDEEEVIGQLKRQYVLAQGAGGVQMVLACEESFKRLMSSSIETEFRIKSKKQADEEAVKVFTENIRELLMAAPLGQKCVLALDPGFRTGCKLVVLDAQGHLRHDDVIYATTGSGSQIAEAKQKVLKYISHFQVEAIAIGNGTASRETETFIKSCGIPASVLVVMVNESGASIYSASEIARKEFPDKDVTVRGAVSIGRRLMDPLAELVKIDPKSIGVGQYQHDVDQNLLKQTLDDAVMSCVNRVGVEVNTASRELLQYISGLNSAIAENIVKYRNENGPFKTRNELKKVSRLGEKAFEQSAGFLRIRGSANPLDASAVHPERYDLVKRMAEDAGVTVTTLLNDRSARASIQLEKYIGGEVGLPTLKDILDELNKPGRDPRNQFEVFKFAEGVEKPEDLRIGMKLPGIITNVTKFGAFVDIGVHQDGLVHVSQLSDKFVTDPGEVVKVAQKTMVTVTEIDLERKRIGLSMKSNPEIGAARRGGEANSPGSQQSKERKSKAELGRKPYTGTSHADTRKSGLNALEDALNQATRKKQ